MFEGGIILLEGRMWSVKDVYYNPNRTPEIIKRKSLANIAQEIQMKF